MIDLRRTFLLSQSAEKTLAFGSLHLVAAKQAGVRILFDKRSVDAFHQHKPARFAQPLPVVRERDALLFSYEVLADPDADPAGSQDFPTLL